MAKIKEEDISLVKDLAISRHLSFPAGAKIRFQSVQLKDRDILAVCYIDAVLTLLNSKGLLKEQVTVDFDLDINESIWEE